MMRILITGTRSFDRIEQNIAYMQERISAACIAFGEGDEELVLVHGGARGVDTVAADAAHRLGLVLERYSAHWDVYGKAAGVIRNQEMVDAGADVCLAFPSSEAPSRGTRDCIDRAKRAGIPVLVCCVPRVVDK